MELVMFVGLPGSGKSTLAAEFARKGYHVHASDAIRAELYGSEEIQGDPNEVFGLLHSRVRENLNSGFSCVMDGTNMNRKHRIQFLKDLGPAEFKKRCILTVVPLEECKRRNAARKRVVEDYVFTKMLRSFQCPYAFEGWDSVEAVCSGEKYLFPFETAMHFSQDNPHHTLTLGEHMASAERYCRVHGYPEEVCEAASYHDCGKLYTKDFHNMRGEPTPTAHFYGHEGYSAYLYLCEAAGKGLCEGEAWKRTLYIASLISWHMTPLNVWQNSPRSLQRDCKLLGEAMYADVMRLHEADVNAH